MVSLELLQDVRKYIADNLVFPFLEEEHDMVEPAAPLMPAMSIISVKEEDRREKKARRLSVQVPKKLDLEESVGAGIPEELYARLQEKDEGFSEFIIRKIDASGMTDAECYTKAQITRQLFNKVKNVKGYRPGKGTAVALGFALGLGREDFDEMLRKAGLSLSKSSEFDLVVEYCIEHGIYDVGDVNDLLFSLDQQLIGSN